jgi:hypothetical protein
MGAIISWFKSRFDQSDHESKKSTPKPPATRQRKRQLKIPQESTPAKRTRKSINFSNPSNFVEYIIKNQDTFAKRNGQLRRLFKQILEIKKGSSFRFEVFGLKNAGLGNGLDSEILNIFLSNGNFCFILKLSIRI